MKTNPKPVDGTAGVTIVDRPAGYGRSDVTINGPTLEVVLAEALRWSNAWVGYEPRTNEARQEPDGSWIITGSRWTRL